MNLKHLADFAESRIKVAGNEAAPEWEEIIDLLRSLDAAGTPSMNRRTYEELIAENLDWLLKQPQSLERDHIELIVRRSANHEFAEAELAAEKKCQNDLAARILGQEQYDNSICQAHPIELVEVFCKDLIHDAEMLSIEKGQLKESLASAEAEVARLSADAEPVATVINWESADFSDMGLRLVKRDLDHMLPEGTELYLAAKDKK